MTLYGNFSGTKCSLCAVFSFWLMRHLCVFWLKTRDGNGEDLQLEEKKIQMIVGW